MLFRQTERLFMKEFDSITFDKATYERELEHYEQLLQTQTILSENKDILPFFKKNRQLLAHIDSLSFTFF